MTGIARFLLTETEPELSLYSTPININPEDPALPISHPTYYATYLAKLLGAYSTLGMAEDTWALNEHAIDSDAFLKQAYLTYEEREAMFLSALDRTRRGVVACVFDTTDRVQHMFFAQKDRGGPYSGVIEDLYMRADKLVGKALPVCGRGDGAVRDLRSRLRVLRARRRSEFLAVAARLSDAQAGSLGREQLSERHRLGAARAPTPSGWRACTSISRAGKRRASCSRAPKRPR